MRIFWSIGLVLLLAACQTDMGASPVGPQTRPQISLCGDWQAQFTKLNERPQNIWTTQKLPGRVSIPKDKEAFWVKRMVTPPKSWQGQKIVVHIGKVVFAATLYVNGEKITDIPGYGREVDLTAHLKLGQPNEIKLFFGVYSRGIDALDIVTYQVANRLKQNEDWGKRAWGSRFAGVLCEEHLFYVEAQTLLP